MIAALLIAGGYAALVWAHPLAGLVVGAVHIVVMVAAARG